MNELLGSEMYARSFNSTLVQLKDSEVIPRYSSKNLFQFYLSSIKSNQNTTIFIIKMSFNSTLVQLKAILSSLVTFGMLSFNSTLVQLKVYLA